MQRPAARPRIGLLSRTPGEAAQLARKCRAGSGSSAIGLREPWRTTWRCCNTRSNLPYGLGDSAPAFGSREPLRRAARQKPASTAPLNSLCRNLRISSDWYSFTSLATQGFSLSCSRTAIRFT